MPALLAIIALATGTVLFLSAGNQIYRHDDGSVGTYARAMSGFVLLVAVGLIELVRML